MINVRKFSNVFLGSLMAIFLASCSREKDEIAPSGIKGTKNMMKHASLTAEGIPLSIEGMLRDGWKIVDTINIRRGRTVTKLHHCNVADNSEESGAIYFTREHLKYMGYDLDTESGKARLRDIFGNKVVFNEYVGLKDLYLKDLDILYPIQANDASTHLSLGRISAAVPVDTTITTIENLIPPEIVVNNTDAELIQEIKKSWKISKKASVQEKRSYLFKNGVTMKVCVPFFADFGITPEQSIEFTKDGCSENIIEEEESRTFPIKVLPRKQVRFVLVKQTKTRPYRYDIQATLKGSIYCGPDLLPKKIDDPKFKKFTDGLTTIPFFVDAIYTETLTLAKQEDL